MWPITAMTGGRGIRAIVALFHHKKWGVAMKWRTSVIYSTYIGMHISEYTDRNGAHPTDLTHALLGMAGILVVLVVTIFSLTVGSSYLVRSGALAAVISSVLIDLTNDDRAQEALGTLAISPVLSAAAQAKANHMAEYGYFAHVSPDGKNSWYWFREAGYKFIYAGENLAVDFSDSQDVESAWMNSPTHRANILNGKFTEIGIATAKGSYQGRPTTFVVQMFGTPASSQAPQAFIRTDTQPSQTTDFAVATAEQAHVSEVLVQPVEREAFSEPVAPTAVLGIEATGISDVPSWWHKLLASPRHTLKYAYYALALLILLLLGYLTELEFKKHHLRHVAAGTFLVMLMGGLFMFASIYFFTEPILTITSEVYTSD
jgi:uncharacterized protein YkwD